MKILNKPNDFLTQKHIKHKKNNTKSNTPTFLPYQSLY